MTKGRPVEHAEGGGGLCMSHLGVRETKRPTSDEPVQTGDRGEGGDEDDAEDLARPGPTMETPVQGGSLNHGNTLRSDESRTGLPSCLGRAEG